MAERRMFTKKITESDAFLDMPASTQALYFHLNMAADDDGFVNNPRKIQRMVGSSDDDLKLLIAKSFIIIFESGIIVIKHWKMHNYIQSDRYKPTDYIDEKSMLELKKNKAYTMNVSNTDTNCIQDVSVGKDRLGKVRLGKVRLGKDIYKGEKKTDAKASIYFPLDQQLDDAFKEFIKMRNKIKKPMTKRAITMMINKINKLEDNNKAVDCLNDSILHCWQDIYPNKEKEQKQASNNVFADILSEMEAENDN
jgi:hypothetical protein